MALRHDLASGRMRRLRRDSLLNVFSHCSAHFPLPSDGVGLRWLGPSCTSNARNPLRDRTAESARCVAAFRSEEGSISSASCGVQWPFPRWELLLRKMEIDVPLSPGHHAERVATRGGFSDDKASPRAMTRGKNFCRQLSPQGRALRLVGTGAAWRNHSKG